jgi:hypothetical protein
MKVDGREKRKSFVNSGHLGISDTPLIKYVSFNQLRPFNDLLRAVYSRLLRSSVSLPPLISAYLSLRSLKRIYTLRLKVEETSLRVVSAVHSIGLSRLQRNAETKTQ